jgi:uncharacterized repeat protein (TIGR01451 family)
MDMRKLNKLVIFRVSLLISSFVLLTAINASAEVADWGSECVNKICVWTLERSDIASTVSLCPNCTLAEKQRYLPSLPEKVVIEYGQEGDNTLIRITSRTDYNKSWNIEGALNTADPLNGNYNYPGGAPFYDAFASCHLNPEYQASPWGNWLEPVKFTGYCDWVEPDTGIYGTDSIVLTKKFNLDVNLVALEVTQSVQDWNNSVPLVEDKRTYVRAYIEHNPIFLGYKLKARLHGKSDATGASLIRSPLKTTNWTSADSSAIRPLFGKSFNFLLPPQWTKGVIRLELELLEGEPACLEPAGPMDPGGDCAVVVKFDPVEELDVKFFRVNFEKNLLPESIIPLHVPAPSIRDVKKTKRRIKDLFPISSMGKWKTKEIDGGELTKDRDMLVLMARVRAGDQCYSVAGCARLYHGVTLLPIVDGVIGSSSRSTILSTAGNVSWAQFQRQNTLNGTYSAAHELAHNLGRPHPSQEPGGIIFPAKFKCADGYESENHTSETFPYFFDANGDGKLEPTLGPMAADINTRIFGLQKNPDETTLTFDRTPQVQDPKRHFALMGYCGSENTWISKYNYEKLIDDIHSRFGEGNIPPPKYIDEKDYIVVIGAITTDGEIREARLTTISTKLQLTPTAGSYILNALDASGNIVSTVTFQPSPVTPNTNGTNTLITLEGYIFSVPILNDPIIRGISIAHVDNPTTILYSKMASANVPSVQILYPNGGEMLSGETISLQWSGTDLDADELTYTIQYSADAGETWETLGVDQPGSPYEVDSTVLKSTSQGLFRVKISDGFFTTWDESDDYVSIPNHSPEIFILYPGGNPLYTDEELVLLDAEVEDVDESIEEINISWTSSLDGVLGTGAHIGTPATNLSEGTHTIIASVVDSEGVSATAQVNIRIQRSTPDNLADLSINKSADKSQVSVGQRIKYTLEIMNQGPRDASNVGLIDLLPNTLKFESINASSGNCNVPTSGGVNCSFSEIITGETVFILISAIALEEGSIENSATVTAAQPDPLLGNNISTYAVSVTPFTAGPEVCDGLDNDGNGLVDEGFDSDGDGYTSCGGDCNDSDAAVNPAAFEKCNLVDDNCNSVTDEGYDADEDGFSYCGGDCNDIDNAINPNAVEICDLKDNNCNDAVDEVCNFYYLDRDADGFGDPQAFITTLELAPNWYIADNHDCDDRRNFVNPNKTEICNNLDDDCDGTVDEDNVCEATGNELPDISGAWDFRHISVEDNCTPPETLEDPGILLIQRTGDSFTAGVFHGSIVGSTAFLNLQYPEDFGQTFESCNGNLLNDGHSMSYECHWTYINVDPAYNCSGTNTYVATILDQDGDGFTPLDNDCDDNSTAIYPGATELPNNGIDENCDGVDFIDPNLDGDGDNYTPALGDCNDYTASIYPGAPEIPNNGVDENCDGADLVDLTLIDSDGDGFTPAQGDCDDSNPAININATEIPNNGVDENCDTADASLTNPDWYITMWNSGYSDWMISPHGHEQLSGEWAAAILYDGIPGGESMWFERNWVCPDWTSNSQFHVISPFHTWDDPDNPVVGYDTGLGVISNGEVEISIEGVMKDGRTIAGLSPGVDTLNNILSHRYVMLQTYRIRNVTSQVIDNVALFQMMHAQPNDEYGPNNYGVFDRTNHGDLRDGFPEYHYDMTFFGSDVNWSNSLDDIIGFSSTLLPNAWGLGQFPSNGCSGGEPGLTSLHHLIEANSLAYESVAGPAEIAGAMRWDLGKLDPGQEVQHTVLFYTGHSTDGLPPAPGLIRLEPELAKNDVGTNHLMTATVTLEGKPVEGVELSFTVISGPHEALVLQAVSDANGLAEFSYTGEESGTDLIKVSGDVDGDLNFEVSNLATKEWLAVAMTCGNPGDLDQDMDVDIDDINLFKAALGSSVGEALFNQCADLDNDGRISLNDYRIMRSLYGTTY